MKIVIVTCYDQADHTRALIVRQGFAGSRGVEPIVIKNSHVGLLRYLEVPFRLLIARFRYRPDAYVVTFRGYEMLPFVLLIKGRKPLVFDELVNMIAYMHEHNRLKIGSWIDKMFTGLYGWLLRRCRFILSDTDAHADLSSSLCRVDRSRYATVPIGADETTFYPKESDKPKKFTVFYYGVMTKLHGLEYFLDAAVELCQKYPDINFITGGDKDKSAAAYQAAKKKGARIIYRPWFPYEELADYMHSSDITVGGPFGNTPQAQFIVTTKTFQALACEVPVLVGRNRVNAAFKDRQNSLVVPQGDAQALVDAISWAHDHPAELERIARAGRKLYEAQFSKTIIAQKIAKIVHDL